MEQQVMSYNNNKLRTQRRPCVVSLPLPLPLPLPCLFRQEDLIRLQVYYIIIHNDGDDDDDDEHIRHSTRRVCTTDTKLRVRSSEAGRQGGREAGREGEGREGREGREGEVAGWVSARYNVWPAGYLLGG